MIKKKNIPAITKKIEKIDNFIASYTRIRATIETITISIMIILLIFFEIFFIKNQQNIEVNNCASIISNKYKIISIILNQELMNYYKLY